MRRNFVFKAFGMALVGLLALPVIIYLTMEIYYLPRISPALSDIDSKKIEIFVSDLRRIERSGFFNHPSRKNNARFFLNDYISWQSPTVEPLLERERKLNEAFNKHPSFLVGQRYFQDFMNDPDIQAIDTDWMIHLKNFDHWEIMGHPENRELLNEAKAGTSLDRLSSLSKLHIPRSSNLVSFAIIRLVKVYKNNPLEAYKEFLHTLRLIHSQNTLVGHTSAAHGFIFAGRIRHSLLPFKGLSHLNEGLGIAMRRTSWVWPSVLDMVYRGPFPERLQPFLKPEYGVCAGASENPLGVRAYFELVQGPSWPLEHDFTKASERSVELRKKIFKVCSMPEFEFLLAPPETQRVFGSPSSISGLIRLDPKTPEYLVTMGKYPYFRRLLYGILSRITIERAFAIYEIKRIDE